MLNNKQFIFGGVAVVIGIISIVLMLSLWNSLEEEIIYQKAEIKTTALPIVPKAQVVTVPEVEAVPKLEEPIKTSVVDDTDDKADRLRVKLKKKNASEVPIVPFYSQFEDISAASWKKVGCGVASLAMLIEYYNPGSVTVDDLLQEGIEADAYLDSAGWTYAGLIGISKKYGLGGKTHDYGNLSMEQAYKELVAELEEGPVMASVHYTFQKSNPIPHLVIINGIEGEKVYYNDPAEKTGGGSISVTQFQSAWKKRYIEFRLL